MSLRQTMMWLQLTEIDDGMTQKNWNEKVAHLGGYAVSSVVSSRSFPWDLVYSVRHLVMVCIGHRGYSMIVCRKVATIRQLCRESILGVSALLWRIQGGGSSTPRYNRNQSNGPPIGMVHGNGNMDHDHARTASLSLPSDHIDRPRPSFNILQHT